MLEFDHRRPHLHPRRGPRVGGGYAGYTVTRGIAEGGDGRSDEPSSRDLLAFREVRTSEGPRRSLKLRRLRVHEVARTSGCGEVSAG